MTEEAALRAFVAARVDEDEAAALGCPSHDWIPVGATVRGGPRVYTAEPGPLMTQLVGRPFPDTVAVPLPREPRPADFWTQVNLHGTTGKFESEMSVAEHIARHDPARVLREVAAKRDHLAMWDEALARRERAVKLAGSDSELHRRASATQRAEANGYCEAVMRLVLADAAVYRDHPDYRQAWAVTEDEQQ